MEQGKKELLERYWNTINALVGNVNKIVIGGEARERFVHLSVITTYLVSFVIGILSGDAYAGTLLSLEKIVSLLSTATVYALGAWIITSEVTRRSWNIISSFSAVLILSQTAMVFNLISPPMSSIVAHLGSFASIVLLFFLEKETRDT